MRDDRQARARTRLPESVNDHDGILAYLDEIERYQKTARYGVERHMIYNVLLYIGLQWIRYDSSLGLYRPLALKSSTPTPVTNKFAATVNQLVAGLVGDESPIGFHPADDRDESVASASVGDHIFEVIKREVGDRQLTQLEAKWLILTGTSFRVTNYDEDPSAPPSFIPYERCALCGAVSDPKTLVAQEMRCSQCGEPGPYLQAADEQGRPIGETVPRGRMTCEAHSPLTLWADVTATSLDESPYVVIAEHKPLDWVERTYGPDRAAEVATISSHDPYSFALNALAYSTASSLSLSGVSDHVERVKVRRLWLRPTPDRFPQGLYAEIIGETVAQSRDWPYHTGTGQPFLNIVMTRCDTVPGRLLGKTRMDDVAVKQEQRNKIEAAIDLHTRRAANTILRVPHGSGVSRLSGEPGFILRYNALAGVPAPDRMPGDNPPAYLIQRLQQIDQEMDMVAGSYEVGRGDAPRGVSAYSALQLLDDRAKKAQSELMLNWQLGKQRWAQQSLDIWREWADDERTLSLGEGAWAVQTFSRADLQGGVNVTADFGQNRPYTQIGRRAVVDQGVRLGVVSPYDPAERFRVLSLLGIPEIMADYKRERADASRENDLFHRGVPVHTPYPWENHPVHLESHKPLTTGERFEAMPPEAQQAILQHMDLHFQAMQQTMAPMGPGQNPPRPGPNGGRGGTAQGDGPSGEMGPDQQMVMRDAQLASPEMFSGAMAGG